MRTQMLPVLAIGLLGVASSLQAKEIKLPEAAPVLSLHIPDDWTVEMSEAGLAATSPQTNSFVYAKILTRPQDDPNKWVNQALEKLEARGVTFETKATAAVIAKAVPAPVATPPVAPSPSVEAKAAPEAPKPGTVSAPPAAKSGQPEKTEQQAKTEVPAKAEASPKPDAPKSEPPAKSDAKADPKAPTSKDGKAADAGLAPVSTDVPLTNSQLVPTMALNANLQQFPLPSSSGGPAKLQRHELIYKGTSRDGKPVDVELVTFVLPNKSVFFLLQESGQTDQRVIDIIKSVKSKT